MTEQELLRARLVKLGIRIFTDKVFRLVRSLVATEKEIRTIEARLHQDKRRLSYLKKQRERLIGEIREEADPEQRRVHRRKGAR